MKGTLSAIAALMAASATHGVNVLRLASAGADGETVTIGTTVFELDTHTRATITAGRVRVNVSGGTTVKASGTLTLSGNAVADETVTIAGRTYTFKATPNAANEVKVGASAEATIDNLVAAITGGAGAGTNYGTGTTVHATVTAMKASASTMTVTALAGGTAGNALGTTEAMTNGSFGAATLASGADPSAANVRDALVTAINDASIEVTAYALGAQVVIAHDYAAEAIACAETLAGSNNGWAAATTYGETGILEAPQIPVQVKRAVTAAEATALACVFGFSSPVANAAVQVRTSAGVLKAWDGKLTIVDNTVQLNSDGSVNLATNDVVTVEALLNVRV